MGNIQVRENAVIDVIVKSDCELIVKAQTIQFVRMPTYLLRGLYLSLVFEYLRSR